MLLVLLVVLLIGCSPIKPIIGEESACKGAYFEYKSGECCLDQNNNSICDLDEVKEPIVNESIAGGEACLTNFEELIMQNEYTLLDQLNHNLANKENYVNKYLAIAESDINYVTEIKEIVLNANEEIDKFCEAQSELVKEYCEESKKAMDQKSLGTTTTREIISLELVSYNSTSCLVKHLQTLNGKKDLKTYFYGLMLNVSNVWKLGDILDQNRKSLLNPDALQITQADWILTFENYVDAGLKDLKIKLKDECFYTSLLEGYTQTEKQETESVCYQGKYFDYAIATTNYIVCNNIFLPDKRANCFAHFAHGTKSGDSSCAKVLYEEWGAIGYKTNINTRDACYYTYSWLEGTYASCHKIKNSEMRNKCLQGL
jgi:hypothetical protein